MISADDERRQIGPGNVRDPDGRQRRRLDDRRPPPLELERALDEVPQRLERVAELPLHPEEKGHLVDLPHGGHDDDRPEEDVRDRVLPLDLVQVPGDVGKVHLLAAALNLFRQAVGVRGVLLRFRFCTLF